MADEATDVQEEAVSDGEASPPADGAETAEASAEAGAPETADETAGGEATADSAAPAEGEQPAAEGGQAVEDAVAAAIASEILDEAALDEASTGDVAAPDPFMGLPEDLPEEVRRILRIEVPVIVKLADKHLPLGDIIDLSPGSIVEFTRSSDTPLELLVNNKVIGRGIAVKVGEKFGLRIDEILPVEQTIRKLGA